MKKVRCWECDRERERSIPVYVTKDGVIYYVCPQCYKQLNYQEYVSRGE